jgi:hypothetical protein
VLIGPGSEWFWTAVSGLVLAVTFFAIYRQLSLQRDSAAIEQVYEFERIWTAERMSRSKLICLEAIVAGVPPIAMPDKASAHVGDHWERIGYLARTRHMDRRFVYEQWGLLAQIWWHRLLPSTAAWRERDQEPGIWSEWEWLIRYIEGMDRKRGVSHHFDAESMARDSAQSAIQMREAVAIEESLRTITVRLNPIPVPVTPSDRPAARGRRRTA